MIGTDVNDKLLLVQALRAAFSDRVLFTTDIDARLLHPEAVRYTRNLIVASSLPLVLDDEILDQKLRARVAPFRDMYQTATFLGARYASADDKQARPVAPAIEKRLEKPILYEIGRDSEVELGIDKVLEHERDRRIGYALLAGGLLLVLGGFMLGRPAPAMQVALPWNQAAPAPFDLATAVVAGLEVGAWGFALGVVIELGLPGHMGPVRVWLLALALMLSFWALVYPGLRFPPADRPDVYVAPAPAWRRQQLALRLLLIVLPVCLVWLWLVPEAGGMREPFAPTSGVSAWPSQLLRTLAVVLFAWFLDYAWGRSATAAHRIGNDYFPAQSSTAGRPAGDALVAAHGRRHRPLARVVAGPCPSGAEQLARLRRRAAGTHGHGIGRGFDLVLAAPGGARRHRRRRAGVARVPQAAAQRPAALAPPALAGGRGHLPVGRKLHWWAAGSPRSRPVASTTGRCSGPRSWPMWSARSSFWCWSPMRRC